MFNFINTLYNSYMEIIYKLNEIKQKNIQFSWKQLLILKIQAFVM